MPAQSEVNLFYPPEKFDYHAWRSAGLGGSDAFVIMNSSPWMKRQELWELKTGRRQPEPPSWPMKQGIKLEPIARDWYENETGIIMRKALAMHRQHDFIRLSLDGFSSQIARPLEIKCPGREDHFTARAGKIPEKYIWQCVQYLLVLNLPMMNYLSYNPKLKEYCGDRDGIILTFSRDKILEEQLLEALFEFHNCIMKDIPPKPEPPCMRRIPKLTLVPKKVEVFKTRKSRPLTQKQSQALLRRKDTRVPIPANRSKGLYSAGEVSEIIELLKRAKELGIEATFNPPVR